MGGWLRSVGSIKRYVNYRSLLQNKRKRLRSKFEITVNLCFLIGFPWLPESSDASYFGLVATVLAPKKCISRL